MGELTGYEEEEKGAIEQWKKELPGVLSKAFGVAVEPAVWLVNAVVPKAAVSGALNLANAVAGWLTDTRDVLRDANVGSLDELRNKNLELSDDLADNVHNWAIGIAVAEGTGSGALGLLGIAIDVPAIITLALRTIHKIGVCYGYDCDFSSELDKNFVLSILRASSPNSIKEKLGALACLKTFQVTLAKVSWKKMTEMAAIKQLSKEGAIIAVRNLAKTLGINLTKRKALAAIPIIGALVGGSVNGWFIKEVGWAARRSFQERWLIENRKIKQGELS